ncbi:MAG: DUF4124 domain-containing protein [Proteobacteria bacterium]|nr:DUF4124 domain-containing protein [Pseudomonadota bacterium]
MTRFISLLLPLSLSMTAVHADAVYKSIDENGNVTYSETPIENPRDVSRIKIAPPPTEEHINAAKERHESTKKAAEIIDDTRKLRDEQEAKEYRIRQERRQQLQQQQQAEDMNRNDQYGYYPYDRLGGGIIINPGRPIVGPPVILPPIARPPAVAPGPGPR